MPELNTELISRAKLSDPAAIEELVSKVRKPLFHYACNFMGSDFEAEDITQEVLVKAIRALPKFKGDSTLWTWLFRIMTNACIDYQRKNASRPILHLAKLNGDEEGAVAAEPRDPGRTPEEQAELAELREEIRAALLQLSSEHRMIVILHDIHCFKYQEISAITGAGLGTVKSRLFYARRELREILGARLAKDQR
jgi:RNA polymerase sigma-70 factor (ECF subfamily)